MTRTEKAFWVVLAVTIWGIGAYIWLFYPFQKIERSVGRFRTRELAVKASIRRLSQEIRRRPGTQTYIIWFRLSEPDPMGGFGAAMYQRRFKQFGWAMDPTSGFEERWTSIDDFTIREIAATNGTFAALGKPAR